MILPICFILAIVASVGGVTPGYLNLNLLGDGVGYFMKPYYPLKNNDSVQEWPFVAMAGASVLRATYGPFEAQQDISQSILNQTAYSQHTPLNYQTVNGMSISAHVVTETILPDRPLQVLFHVSLSAKRVNSNSSEPSPPTSLCFAVYATKDNKTLSSSCLINDTSEVCIAEVILPLNWWSDKLAQTVDVSYLVYGNTASSCSNGKNPSGNRVFLSGVTLTQGQMSYQEMKEDQHILIYVPQAVFSPGARFRVPVKLQAESDLEAFAIRVKTKQGIKIIGAQAKNSSRDSWQVQTDVNMKQQNAVVAARAVENYSKTSRIQDIFDWIFEVDDTNSNADRCRLSFSIEYEMSFGHRVKYGVIENKATVRIQIHQDKTFAIVPVVKTIELINTALLTGKPQSYPLRIFSISYSGQIQDITTQTTCHSGDETVLKVDESCGTIFLTDQETKGSSSVSIIAKHGRHTRFLFLKVWVPELPLEIDLSDSKLSQVVGWRVPAPEPARPASSEPGRTVADERLKNLDDQSSCQLRYQSSLVDVYARFITSDDIQNPYLLHRNAMFRITNLVRDRIRSADESVALVKGVVVDGLKPGRTEIQVMSRSGRVIAAKQFKVSNEKVNINRMEANVVSGLKLSMDTKSDYPGSLTARLSVMRMLNRKDQEAFVDVVLGFDDETVLPLWAVPQSHYILDIEVSDDSVIQAQLTTVQSIVVPKVIASAAGAKQSLKMKFSASGACPLPKMRPMAISHSVINVEIVDKKMKVTTTENPGGLYKGWPESSSNTLPKQEAHMSSKTASSSSGIRLSSMEMAMYILLLIFCIAAAVFAVNCMLFAARRKRLFKVKGDVDSVCEVENDWVWIGHKTLERNAVNTTCLETLMPDADFNGNSNNQGPLMELQEDNQESNVGGVTTSTSINDSRHSVGSGSAKSGGIPNEMDNPLDDNPSPCLASAAIPISQDSKTADQKPDALDAITLLPSLTSSAPRNDASFGGKKEKKPPHKAVWQKPGSESPNYTSWYSMTRAERLKQLEEAVASGSDVDWDCEDLDMTHEQLLQYIDSLKESSA